MRASLHNLLPGGYKHFNSEISEFFDEIPKLKGGSVNNHAVNLSHFTFPYRATCFVRDPRDLVISGYFYHRRGVESWTNIKNPDPTQWSVVNGNIPQSLKPGQSFSEFLQDVDTETGLLAEIDFRKFHFGAMREWDLDQPNLFVFKYENVVGREPDCFRDIAEIYEFSEKWKSELVRQANRYSLQNLNTNKEHVRDPNPRQWSKYFTNNIRNMFKSKHNDKLVKLGYEAGMDW